MSSIVTQLAPLWQRLEQERGLPLGFMDRMAKVESSYNPNARNPKSSAGGLFQFIDSTARNYGLADKFDPVASSEAAARLASDNAAYLRKNGIEPTAGNLYLAHQQGPAGAVKLLRNGDAPASSVVGGAEAGLNGGGGLSASAMANKWTSKFADIDGTASASPFAPPKETTAMAAPNPADVPAPGAVETVGNSQFAIPGGTPAWGQADNDQLMMALSLIANAIPNGQVAKDPGSVIKPFMDMRARRDDREYARSRDLIGDQRASRMEERQGKLDAQGQSNADRAYNLQVEAQKRADDANARAAAAAGRPQWGVIGQDDYGNNKYGWISPGTMQVIPGGPIAPPPGSTATPTPAPSPSGAAPTAPAEGAPIAPPTAAAPDSVVPPPPPGVNPKVWRDEWSKKLITEGQNTNPYALGGKPTEEMSKAAGYANRMVEGHGIIANLEGVGTDKWQAALNAAPIVGNSLISSDKQQLEQAKRNFINANLRRESGAVISPEEFANGEKQYFPMPGDSPEVIAQKRANRETAIKGVMGAAGQGYKPPDDFKPGATPPASARDQANIDLINKSRAAKGQPLKVLSPEHAMSLPPGTKIELPDGSVGTVPAR